MRILSLLIALMLVACDDETTSSLNSGPGSDRGILTNPDASFESPDLRIIEHTVPDAYVDPCIDADSSSEFFCQCNPQ